jgi:hypothetical protein
MCARPESHFAVNAGFRIFAGITGRNSKEMVKGKPD